MKTIKLNNKSIEVKTSLDEINITEFEACINIFKATYDSPMDQYVEILQVLSNFTRDEIEELELELFETIIRDIQISDFTEIGKIFINEFELDGQVYKTKSDGLSYKFTVKEMFLLQEIIKESPEHYILDVAGIIFREVDSEGNISNDLSKATIAKRKEKFAHLKMNIIGPYIMTLSNFFINRNA